MAATTPIGNVDKFIIKTINQYGETVETSLNKNFVENSEATYTAVDQASRALIALSKNSYSDTICVTNISTNEQIAG